MFDLACFILRYLSVSEVIANLKPKLEPFLFETKSDLFNLNLNMRDDRLKAQDDSIVARGNSSRDLSFLLLSTLISSTTHIHCLCH